MPLTKVSTNLQNNTQRSSFTLYSIDSNRQDEIAGQDGSRTGESNCTFLHSQLVYQYNIYEVIVKKKYNMVYFEK